MRIHNRTKYFLLFFLLPVFVASAQNPEQLLSLRETMDLARQRSLDAFRSKRQYAIHYWSFRSFESSLLPQVDLTLEPFTYNRAFIKRYDADRNVDVYRLQQNLSSYARVSLSQNIMLTGATVFLSSSFDRLANFGDYQIDNYSTTPLRVGLVQPIMAFNPLKWKKKTASLEFERAKKEFLQEQQQINIKAVDLFFRWALATTRVEIEKENRDTAERLYEMGKKRYELGAIEKDEILNLELDSFTSNTSLTKSLQDLESVMAELKLFLNLEDMSDYIPELPEMISNLKIDVARAEELLQEYNPELLSTRIRTITAERDLDRAIKENRFDLSLDASYGLSQQATEFENAYSNFLDQQIVAVRFSMPLLDWGERKGNIQTARMTKELADIEIEQTQNDILRQLQLTVNNFNLQEEQVLAALRARNISRESYQVSEKRFLSGQVDLLRLTSSRRAWQAASEQYVQQLRDYWSLYYEVQQLTLFNFMASLPLTEDFEQLLQE